MAALFGYMLAIVITLGGYLTGLHWLINPPDPWLPNPKLVQSGVQQFAKKRVPIVKPVEANPIALTASADTGAKPANSKIPTPVSASETEDSQSTDRVFVQASHPATKPTRLERPEAPRTRLKSFTRKRDQNNTSRGLEIMVLRTYERSDGTRFSRLLPVTAARNTIALQPVNQW
jgi:hypothetical protein